MPQNNANQFEVLSPYEVKGFAFHKNGEIESRTKTILNTRRIYHRDTDSQRDAIVINLIVLFKGVEFYHEHADHPHLFPSLAQDLQWHDAEAEALKDIVTIYMDARRRWAESFPPYYPYRLSNREKTLKTIVNHCNVLARQQPEPMPYTNGRKAHFAFLRETFTNELNARPRGFINKKLVPDRYEPEAAEQKAPSRATSRASSTSGANADADRESQEVEQDVGVDSSKENVQDVVNGPQHPVEPTPTRGSVASQSQEHVPQSPTAQPIPAAVLLNHRAEMPPGQAELHEADDINAAPTPSSPPPEYDAAQSNADAVLLGFIQTAKDVVQHPGLSDVTKTEILAMIASLEARDATL